LDPVNSPENTGLFLTREQYETILLDVWLHKEEEACGLVGGVLPSAIKIYPVANALHSPTRFRMDAHEQVRALMDIEQNGWELLAIYHSHLQGPGEPSETDKNEFAYPGVIYLIVDLSKSKQTLRGFKLLYSSWIEIPINIKD